MFPRLCLFYFGNKALDLFLVALLSFLFDSLHNLRVVRTRFSLVYIAWSFSHCLLTLL